MSREVSFVSFLWYRFQRFCLGLLCILSEKSKSKSGGRADGTSEARGCITRGYSITIALTFLTETQSETEGMKNE